MISNVRGQARLVGYGNLRKVTGGKAFLGIASMGADNFKFDRSSWSIPDRLQGRHEVARGVPGPQGDVGSLFEMYRVPSAKMRPPSLKRQHDPP